MSYILDALKKADSERQHGKMPDIYSHQPGNDVLEKEESGWNKPIVWILTALVILLTAFLLFINVYRTPTSATLVPGQTSTPSVTTSIPPAPATQSTPPA